MIISNYFNQAITFYNHTLEATKAKSIKIKIYLISYRRYSKKCNSMQCNQPVQSGRIKLSCPPRVRNDTPDRRRPRPFHLRTDIFPQFWDCLLRTRLEIEKRWSLVGIADSCPASCSPTYSGTTSRPSTSRYSSHRLPNFQYGSSAQTCQPPSPARGEMIDYDLNPCECEPASPCNQRRLLLQRWPLSSLWI